MNRDGNTANLLPGAPEGNRNREVHGAYGRRQLDPQAREIAAVLLAAEHTVPLDRFAAEEIGALVAQLDRIDAALADGRVESRGRPRGLIALRGQLSTRLQAWLRDFGLTPRSRAEFVESLARGSLADEIRKRREEARDA